MTSLVPGHLCVGVSPNSLLRRTITVGPRMQQMPPALHLRDECACVPGSHDYCVALDVRRRTCKDAVHKVKRCRACIPWCIPLSSAQPDKHQGGSQTPLTPSVVSVHTSPAACHHFAGRRRHADRMHKPAGASGSVLASAPGHATRTAHLTRIRRIGKWAWMLMNRPPQANGVCTLSAVSGCSSRGKSKQALLQGCTGTAWNYVSLPSCSASTCVFFACVQSRDRSPRPWPAGGCVLRGCVVQKHWGARWTTWEAWRRPEPHAS